jgi:two-component system, cell cycle sensor histidine kinase and response regulator CckA
MTWHNLRVLLVTSPPEPNLDVIAAASLDAIVLQCDGNCVPVGAVAATRPEVPLIVLADADEATSLRLIGAGADEVLPLAASMVDIVRVAQQALTRKQREHGTFDIDLAPAAPMIEAGTIPPQLEAIGRLAGGVAQDFNNLLMIIEGNAERLLAALPDDDPQRARVAAISAASRRGVVLTQKLLAFGRRQPVTPSPVDLNSIITDCAPLLRRRLGRGIRLVTQLDPDLPQVRADRAQMVQVLSNVARTAAEAMPDGGTFTIASDTTAVDAEMRRSRPWLASGHYVRLQLTDSGAGIEERSLPHVFEPFYVPGGSRGDGLDLPSVYGVVKQSGGFIWIDSQTGKGTRITILLPPLGAAERRASQANATAPRVLLVEDDDEVRELLIDVLNSHGLRVTPVGSAEEAITVEAQQTFDLLLTDIGLPGATGTELARQIRRRSPRLPILFISGQSGDIFGEDGELDSPRGFLQKPFSSRALVASLTELLQPQREEH